MAAAAKRHARSDGAAMAPVEISGADADLGLDLSSDIQGILTALQQVRKKAKTDGQKKNEEILNSVKSEILSLADETKLKTDKERQTLLKAATKMAKECEASLKAQATKYQSIYEKFCKEREDHLRSYEDAFSKFEEAKEALLTRFEQQRKKEKTLVGDLQKSCSDKIAAAEEQLKRKSQEDKSFTMLRKTLGSFFEDIED